MGADQKPSSGSGRKARRSAVLGGIAWIVLLIFLLPAWLVSGASGQPSTAEWFIGIGLCLARPLALLLALIGLVIGLQAFLRGESPRRLAILGLILNGVLLLGHVVYFALNMASLWNMDLTPTVTYP